MNHLSLNVGILPGADLSEAISEAIALANMLGIAVEFVFNDIPLLVHEKSNPVDVEERFYMRRKRRIRNAEKELANRSKEGTVEYKKQVNRNGMVLARLYDRSVNEDIHPDTLKGHLKILLENMADEGLFGDEGELHPTGDQRCEPWSMERVQGLDNN